jgi:hypothetical protein
MMHGLTNIKCTVTIRQYVHTKYISVRRDLFRLHERGSNPGTARYVSFPFPLPIQLLFNRYSRSGLANFKTQEGHTICNDPPEGRTSVYMYEKGMGADLINWNEVPYKRDICFIDIY